MSIWVIGSRSGIGQETARVLAMAPGTPVQTCHTDVRSVTASYDMMDMLRGHSEIDGIVYCAGVNKLDYAKDISEDDLTEIYSVNVHGFIRLMKAIGRVNWRGPRGVVAVGSDAAYRPMRTSMVYCSSKAALHMAVQCAAREFAPLRVNAVAPGMTEGTCMTDYIDKRVPVLRGWSSQQAADYEKSQIPMGRRAMKAEVAHVIKQVLNGPAYQTGSIVTINGGR